MKTWMKVALGAGALVAAVVVVLGGMGAYFIMRHLESTVASEAESSRAMDAIRAGFGSRPPLLEVVDPRRADIRINRLQGPGTAAVDTVHIATWKAETRESIRTEVPLWLMRFSSVNVLSHLGIAPARFRLTVADIEQYGPGIIVDYRSANADRILVWVD